jgi:16S rRNA (cytidine1402-2'-O)-methyltransferase
MLHPLSPAGTEASGPDQESLRTLDLLLAELPVKTAVRLCADITRQPRNALYQAALARKAAQSGDDTDEG